MVENYKKLDCHYSFFLLFIKATILDGKIDEIKLYSYQYKTEH